MGLPQTQDASTLDRFTTRTVDTKYLVWLINHQHLFGPHPSAYMPASAEVNITVQANGVDIEIHISHVPYDANLPQSLIRTDYARSTYGRIEPTGAPLSLQDADGNLYRSSSYITLRWWLSGRWLSDSERFYITDDLPGSYHAMLRRAPEKNAQDRKEALPLFNPSQTIEEQNAAEQKRKLEEKAHSARRDAENQKIIEKTRLLKSPSSKQSGNLNRAMEHRRK